MTPATPTPTPLVNITTFPVARFTDLGVLMSIITPLISIGAALIFGYMLLRAAFLWITAGEDVEKTAQARQIMTYAIIGIVIILSAYTIVKLVAFIFKVDLPL